MLPLEFTPATVILLIIIAVGVVFAVRRLVRRGMCDCDDHCGDSGCAKKGCSHCSAAEDMVKNMDQHVS